MKTKKIRVFQILIVILLLGIVGIISLPHGETAYAEGSIKVLTDFNFYMGSSYYFRANLVITNVYSANSKYISGNTVNFSFTYGSENFSSGMRTGATITVTLSNGTNSYSESVYCETDYGCDDGWKKGGAVSISNVADGKYKISISGTSWRSGSGSYNINYTSGIEICVDSNNPTVSCSSVSNNGYTNAAFTVTASDSSSGVSKLYYKTPGTTSYSFVENTSKTITERSTNGWYEFYAIDNVGHKSSTYKIYYDNKTPTVSCKTVSNGGYTKSAFTVTASDNSSSGVSKLYYKTPGTTSYSFVTNTSKTITEGSTNGWYEFYCTDKAGNQSAGYKIYYDSVVPIITCATVNNGGYTANSFTVSVVESGSGFEKLYIKCPGDSSFLNVGANSKTITKDTGDGWYEFYCTDKAGNQSEEYKICLDTIFPVLTSYTKNGNTFVDGSYLNANVYFAITDASPYSFVFYRKENGKYIVMDKWNDYRIGTVYFDSREGATTYNKFYNRDEAIDYIAIKEYSQITQKTNWTTAVGGTIIDSESSYSKIGATYWVYFCENDDTNYIFFDEERVRNYALNKSATYLQSSTINYFWEEGDFKVVVTDAAGNAVERTFVSDFTKPIGETENVNFAGYASGDFSYYASDDVAISFIQYQVPNSNEWIDVQGNNKTIYSTGTNGTYKFRAYDKAGNISEICTVVLDTVKPTLALTAQFYKSSETVRATVTDTNLEKITLANNKGALIYSGANRTWNTNNLDECTYILTAYDKAGNASSASFVVDKTAPSFSVNAYYNASETISAVITEIYYSKTTLDGNEISVIKNTISVPAKELTDGTHTLIVYDSAGNSATSSFIVDKTAPVFTVSEFYKLGQTVQLNISEKNPDYVLLDGIKQDNTKKSWTVGTEITEGVHTIKVIDMARNETAKTFIVDTVSPEILCLSYYNEYATISLSITETYLDYVTLDGKEITNLSFPADTLSESSHTIMAHDKAGNASSASFVVDKTAPSITLSAQYYKAGQIVSLTITDKNLDYVTLDGETNNGRNFNADELSESEHTIIAYDLAGNYSERKFVIDRTLPSFSVNSYYKAGQTVSILNLVEKNFSNLILKKGSTTIYDGSLTNWNTNNLDEGSYSVTVFDIAGNSSTKSFIIDKTAPVFSVNNYYKAGEVISLNLVEANLNSITISGKGTTQERQFNASDFDDGSYTVTVSDLAGNVTAKSFTVDKTAPSFSVNAYYNASETVTLKITEVNLDKITLDGTECATSIKASELSDGVHTIKVIDMAKNETAKTFIVDKTVPVFSVNKFYKAGEVISLNLVETNLNSINITGKGITSETSFNASDFDDGSYTVTVSDMAGNVTAKSFTVDKTAPSFSVNAYYNASETVTLKITELNLDKITLDGAESGTSIEASELSDGVHTIKVVDIAKNETSKTFIVDKTAPIFSLKDFYAANETISLVIEESNLDRVTLDGVVTAERSWNADNLAEGEHTVVVFDKAKNSSTATFFFKTAAPLLTLRKNGVAVTSGAYLSFADTAEVVINDTQFDYMTFNGVRVSDLNDLGSFQWKKEYNAQELEEGTHTIIIYDKAKNETSLIFTIDKTLPTLTFRVNGQTVSGDIHVKSSDSLSFVFSDINLEYAMLDGEITTTTQYSVASLAEFVHTFVVCDKAGNVTYVDFTVDKTAPIISLNGYYNASETIAIELTEQYIDYIVLDGAKITNLSFPADTLSESSHTITAYDKAGNTSSASFVVDKTAPTFSLKEFYSANDVIFLSVIDKNLDYVTLDGAVTTITTWQCGDFAEGKHTVIAYDKAQNMIEHSFFVDKTSPQITAKANGSSIVNNGGYVSDVIEFVILEENLDRVTLDGAVVESFSFNATDLTETQHTFIAYDKAQNSSMFVFYIDRTAPSFSLRDFYSAKDVILLSIVEKNLDYVTLDGAVTNKNSWQGADLPDGVHTIIAYDKAQNYCKQTFTVDTNLPIISGTVNGMAFSNGCYLSANTQIEFDVIEDNLVNVTLNGIVIDDLRFLTDELEEKEHTIIAIDKAGNTSSVSFIVDKTAPSFGLRDYYSAKDVILLSIVEKNFDRVTLDGAVTNITSWQGAELPDGVHRIVAYDKAGNASSASFVVDTKEPKILLYKNGIVITDDVVYLNATDIIRVNVTESNLDYVSFGDIITQEEVFRATELENRTYILTAYDLAGNSSYRTIIVDKDIPTVTLRKNGIATESGDFFRESATVSIVVSDDNLDYVMLDDVITDLTSWKASELYEGEHIISACDRAGNNVKLSFIIDKTAPIFDLQEYYRADETLDVVIEELHFDYLTLKGAEIIYTGNARNFDVSVLEERTYILTVYDKAGNASSANFVVDKTAPIINVNAYYKASDNIKISITESHLDYFFIDGEVTTITTYSAVMLEDGVHTIVACDKAGNTAETSFIVDKVAPIIYLANYYNATETVYLDVIEDHLASVLFDGKETSEKEYSAAELSEGIHSVTMTDLAGNVTKVTFVVDKTAPIISHKEYYKESDTFYISVSETNPDYIEFDGTATEITVWQCTQLEEGVHTIVAYDKAGNSAVASFIVDKVAPVISATANGKEINSSYFGTDVVLEININEPYLKSVTVNGKNFTGSTFVCADYSDLEYIVRAIDLAGNVATWTFTVDKTAPNIILRRNTTVIDGEGAYVSAFDTISALITDKNLAKIEFDGADTIVYSFEGSSLADGTHTFTAYDLAGNVTVVSFIVHKAAPAFELKEYYVSGEYIKLDLSEESIDYVLLDNAITYQRSWYAASLGEGIHRIKAVDLARNETEKVFCVDTKNPTLELMKNSEKAKSGIFVNASDTISIIVEDANFDYVTLDGEVTTTRLWKCDNLSEREHTIVAYDKAGNYTSIDFICDKTAPSFELKEYYIEGETVYIDVNETYIDGIYLNGSRVFNYAYEARSLGEGSFVLSVSDKAGNTAEKTFVVDLSAPILTIIGTGSDGELVEMSEGNSFGKISVTASDISLYALYARFNGGEYIEYGTSIQIDNTKENEGTWEFYGKDINGHVSDVVTVTVDFSVPIVNADFIDNEKEKGYTSSAFTISPIDTFPKELYYRHESIEDFSLCSQLDFTVTAVPENEGAWYFYAVDGNGLVSETLQVVLDLGAPSFDLSGLVTVREQKGYTNTTFTYMASDYHFASIICAKVGGTTVVIEDQTVTIENTKENEGVWRFYAEDVFGQKTEVYTVTLSFTFDFKNIEDIKNSFKQNTWYTVSLPGKIYAATTKPDISGTYTFADYETALQFAIDKEKEYRVYPVSEGGFGYVSMSNGNVYITYQNDAELDAAILFYAKKYVSARKIFSNVETRNRYENITNAGYESDVSALTKNEVEVPEFLFEYDLPIYLARQSFVPGNNKAMSPSNVRLTYLGNLTGAVEPYSFNLIYGESLSAAMSRASNLYEGYYLYEESDLCGNIQRVILFIDLSLPTLQATITRGDGTDILTISKDTVGEHSGVFYALSFEITALFDNMDEENVSVAIMSESYSAMFTIGDELPILNKDLGSGRYNIVVYDRSYNSIEFTVIIAGNEPSWYYTSLSASSKKLSIYINKNDNNNAIIYMEVIKIRSDGTYTVLTEDDEGTEISTATLTYVFTTGGKYGLRLLDMYGRNVEMTPIFYEKGLPFGTFTGTINGGETKDNVTFTYGSTYGLTAYYLNGTNKVPVSGISPVFDAVSQSYSVSFEGVEGATIEYSLLLYLLSDEGIYIEYSFTIDKESPLFSIKDINGTPVTPNGSTNKPFCVEWGESNIVARFQRDGYSMQNYVSGTLIMFNTLYTFSLRDKVGNETTFTVYLDSEVSFHLSGKYTILDDGNILTNSAQQIIPEEELSAFSLADGEGNTYSQDDILSVDGTYVLTMTDIYGNTVNLKITLDFIAPTIEIDGVNEFNLANGTVTVSCSEAAACINVMNSNGTVKETVPSGKKFVDIGTYVLRVSDEAGNFNTYSFEIDKTIAYTVTAVNGLVTTANVSFVFSEDVSQEVTLDGEQITSDNRYYSPGEYNVTLCDRAGNTAQIAFTILPQRMQTFVCDLPDGISVASITKEGQTISDIAQSISLTESGTYDVTLYHTESKKNYYFKVIIDNTPPEITITQKTGGVSLSNLTKKNVVMALYKNGELVEGFSGGEVKEKGDYVLVLTDDVGNVQTYEFKVKFALNTFSIILIVIGSLIAVAIIVLAIKGRRVKAA